MLPSASLVQKQSTEAQTLTQQEAPDDKSQTVSKRSPPASVEDSGVHSSYAYPESARGRSSDVILNVFLAFQCHRWAIVLRAKKGNRCDLWKSPVIQKVCLGCVGSKITQKEPVSRVYVWYCGKNSKRDQLMQYKKKWWAHIYIKRLRWRISLPACRFLWNISPRKVWEQTCVIICVTMSRTC